MPNCLPTEIKDYVAQHLKDDAEHHLSMTTPEYRSSHQVMWGYIDWEQWVKLMQVQAEYSKNAAELIGAIGSCEE